MTKWIKDSSIERKAGVKVSVDVQMSWAEDIAKEINSFYKNIMKREITPAEAAEYFAQDIVNRYFDKEYLHLDLDDAEELLEELGIWELKEI